MIRAIALAALLFVLLPAPANAAATCTLSSSGTAFGVFSGPQLTIVGSILMHCTGSGTSNYNLTLSTGAGTYASRQMKNGSNSLSYNLYRDPAFTQIWGNGTGGSSVNTGQIIPRPTVDINVSIYGKIPAQVTPTAGSYSDTIVATLTCTSGGACTTTTTFVVTASVQPACTISATDLTFGTYAQAQLDGQSQIQLTCTNATPWNVGLNAGTFPGATVANRAMSGPGGFHINYQIFKDPARSTNWGNIVGTDTVSGTGSGGVQALTVYGRIPASQSVRDGGYVDTITATITF